MERVTDQEVVKVTDQEAAMVVEEEEEEVVVEAEEVVEALELAAVQVMGKGVVVGMVAVVEKEILRRDMDLDTGVDLVMGQD